MVLRGCGGRKGGREGGREGGADCTVCQGKQVQMKKSLFT